jgi:hypothetical protein
MPKKRRVVDEKFYTDASLVERCVKEVDKIFPLLDFDLIVEPSAGDGAFLAALPRNRLIAIDTKPEHPAVLEADYLKWAIERGEVGRTLTVGNPPFGVRGSLAIRFIRKAAQYSDVIAFILPRIFKKHTFQGFVDPYFHCVAEFDCCEFHLPDGCPYRVNCVFQVWERRKQRRENPHLEKSHPDFCMVHCHPSRVTKEQLAEIQARNDFAIAQVGSNFKPKPTQEVVAGSHWFIRAEATHVLEVFERMDFSFLDNTNTAFKSLSKKDIVRAYKEALEARNEE